MTLTKRADPGGNGSGNSKAVRKAGATPQQARSHATRRKLLNAAIDAVSELGYAGATMDQVVARAGVSRGAQMHHFPTKSLLMQSALTEMLDAMIADVQTQAEVMRQRRENPTAVFKHLWDKYFSKQLFAVTIELIVASRTDKKLRDVLTPVSTRFHQQIEESFRFLQAEGDLVHSRIGSMINLTMSLLRGLGVQTVLYDRPEDLRKQLSDWIEIFEQVIMAGNRERQVADRSR